MKLKQLSEVELELLSHTDLAEMILEESKKTMSTAEIFKSICETLNYSESQYTNKIGDFYTSMTTDKRFFMLEDATWDLKKRHIVPLILDEEEDSEEVEDEEEIIEEEELESVEDKLNNMDDDSIDTGIDDDNDLSDLTIVDEEDLED